MKIFTINLALLATIPLTIWLAATNRIGWWTVVAIWASHVSAMISFRKR